MNSNIPCFISSPFLINNSAKNDSILRDSFILEKKQQKEDVINCLHKVMNIREMRSGNHSFITSFKTRSRQHQMQSSFEKTDQDKQKWYFTQCLGNPYISILWVLEVYKGSERDWSNSQHRNPLWLESTGFTRSLLSSWAFPWVPMYGQFWR